MALQNFQFQVPCNFQGLEDHATDDQKPLAFETIRRLSLNFETLIDALRTQVVVDTSIVPSLLGGEGTTTDNNIIVTNDLDEVEMLSIFMDF